MAAPLVNFMLFMVAIALLALYGLTFSGHFPAEFRGLAMQFTATHQAMGAPVGDAVLKLLQPLTHAVHGLGALADLWIRMEDSANFVKLFLAIHSGRNMP